MVGTRRAYTFLHVRQARHRRRTGPTGTAGT